MIAQSMPLCTWALCPGAAGDGARSGAAGARLPGRGRRNPSPTGP